MSTEPAWKAEKAALDAMDDGDGPYMCWLWSDAEVARRRAYWQDFLVWATDNLGQGYSLACCEGSVIDPVTSHCFEGFVVGREWVRAKDRHPQGGDACGSVPSGIEPGAEGMRPETSAK